MKKGAIFDMDGTLLDTEKIYQQGWSCLASQFVDVPNEEVPIAVSGSGGQQVLDILQKYYPGVDGKSYLQAVLDYYVQHTQEVECKEGVIEILEYFKKKDVKLAVASSTFHEQIVKNLENAGIASYFDSVVSCLDVGKAKPEPDVFLEASRQLGLKPEECYVFEDAKNGIIAAHRANCLPIMVIDSKQPDEEVKGICHHIYDSMNEALEDIQADKI